MRKTHTSHPVFDVESEIIKQNYPCPVDLKSFQDQIDLITGKDITGKSRVRIVWGQRETMIVCGQWRAKYPFYRHQKRHERTNPATGITEFRDEIIDIGTPRFYVEELHSDAELQEGDRWERSRFIWDGFQKIDVLGPIPAEGFYTTLFLVAFHDHLCCRGEGHVKGEKCLGAFRLPTEMDLERIRKMKYLRDNASNQDNAPSDELLAKRTEGMREGREEIWRKRVRETIDDWAKTHSHAFTTLDPVKQQWGKYHFLGAHNKSGLKKEEKSDV